MQTASYVALSRQTVLNRSIEVLANNLANASTTGFKIEQATFQEYLSNGPNGGRVSYVRDGGTVRDTHQGDLVPTNNPLDAAIDGEGYLSIGTANGPRYSRNGHFQLDPQGQVVTARGNAVLDDRGQPIVVQPGSGPISMTSDGTISAGGTPVGKLGLVRFDDQQAMKTGGDGLLETTAPANPDTGSTVRGGFLESSNVQPVTEVTRLMELQRAYQSSQDILDGEDTRLKNAIDKLGRVA